MPHHTLLSHVCIEAGDVPPLRISWEFPKSRNKLKDTKEAPEARMERVAIFKGMMSSTLRLACLTEGDTVDITSVSITYADSASHMPLVHVMIA